MPCLKLILFDFSFGLTSSLLSSSSNSLVCEDSISASKSNPSSYASDSNSTDSAVSYKYL